MNFRVFSMLPGPSIPIIELLIREFNPHGIRFGVGIGDIYTEIDADKSIGADGPAYHRARDCINKIKITSRNNGFLVNYSTDTPDSILINAICTSISGIMNSWTEKQRQAVWTTENNKGSQKLTAKALGINPSSVTRHLKAANFTDYLTLLDSLKLYLMQQYDEDAMLKIKDK